MSDHWLQLIPADPQYVPAKPAQKQARALLEQFLPEAEEINSEVTKKPRFFHPGQNWAGTRCCKCRADLSALFEREEFLGDQQFADLTIVTPCRKKRVSLNDLKFGWPAGFARFVLEAMNPELPKLTPRRIAALEKELGCKLRQVFLWL